MSAIKYMLRSTNMSTLSKVSMQKMGSILMLDQDLLYPSKDYATSVDSVWEHTKSYYHFYDRCVTPTFDISYLRPLHDVEEMVFDPSRCDHIKKFMNFNEQGILEVHTTALPFFFQTISETEQVHITLMNAVLADNNEDDLIQMY